MKATWCALLVLLVAGEAHAQRAFFGAGIGGSTIPRAVSPVCGPAGRLNGATATGVAGVSVKSVRVAVVVDLTATGTTVVASCVPRSGLSVDSVFAPADNSATAIGLEAAWQPVRALSLGVGAGWIPSHDNRFVSGTIGVHYWKLRAEVSGRWHRAAFEKYTREYSEQGVREISHSSESESSWGGVFRVLWVSR